MIRYSKMRESPLVRFFLSYLETIVRSHIDTVAADSTFERNCNSTTWMVPHQRMSDQEHRQRSSWRLLLEATAATDRPGIFFVGESSLSSDRHNCELINFKFFGIKTSLNFLLSRFHFEMWQQGANIFHTQPSRGG